MEIPPAAAEELMKKIEDLEAGQARLKHDLSMLFSFGSRGQEETHNNQQQSMRIRDGEYGDGAGGAVDLSRTMVSSSLPLHSEVTMGVSDAEYLKILQSMGQSVHIIDLHGRIIFWNHSAECLYGFSASEAIGQYAVELIVNTSGIDASCNIVDRVTKGETWKGKFPIKKKSGERFICIATHTPLYHDDGHLVGVICVTSDSEHFPGPASPAANTDGSNKKVPVPQTLLQTVITSKISNLAIKVTNIVRSRIKTSEQGNEYGNQDDHYADRMSSNVLDGGEDTSPSGTITSIGNMPNPFGLNTYTAAEDKTLQKILKSNNENLDNRVGIQKILSSKAEAIASKTEAITSKIEDITSKSGGITSKSGGITSKAEAWISKKSISWPWKGNDHDDKDARNRVMWPWSHSDLGNVRNHPKTTDPNIKPECQANEIIRTGNAEISGSWSSFNHNSASSCSSCGSTSSSVMNKMDFELDSSDCEILWEDLTIGQQIGEGSCGTVYHALWFGSDVAAKVFSRKEYTDEVLLSFRQEVSLMKRLRHPNILLFMGVVASPQRLCIITEFLPRGSLFRLLRRNTNRLDWRRRSLMALDIARGMNYLHHCNPPVVHRDLKSLNLLVDKNWNVKVGDFGLSHLKHETYLTAFSRKGTPQWLAPEVLRNEPSNEKADVYSFGVILWELVTEKIPWENFSSMQVIGAVGYMNHRLEIPSDVDPQWTSIIESCWNSEPECRPSFQDLVERFRDLQRLYTIQSQMNRSNSSTGASSHGTSKG